MTIAQVAGPIPENYQTVDGKSAFDNKCWTCGSPDHISRDCPHRRVSLTFLFKHFACFFHCPHRRVSLTFFSKHFACFFHCPHRRVSLTYFPSASHASFWVLHSVHIRLLLEGFSLLQHCDWHVLPVDPFTVALLVLRGKLCESGIQPIQCSLGLLWLFVHVGHVVLFVLWPMHVGHIVSFVSVVASSARGPSGIICPLFDFSSSHGHVT